MKNWPQMTGELSALLKNLRSGAPQVMKAFSGIAQSALAPNALDGKTKELIALGICVAVRCDDCIAFHVKAAFEQGASREEVTEALGMAIYMGALGDVREPRARGVRSVCRKAIRGRARKRGGDGGRLRRANFSTNGEER